MIQIRRLQPTDFLEIEKHPKTIGILDQVSMEQATALSQLPYSLAATVDGKVIGIGGVIERWPGRGEGWAIFAPGTKGYIPQIVRAVKQLLEDVDINRVEVAVACDFVQGHEFAHAIGLEAEAECLRAYDSEGNDCSMYARVKKTKGGS